MPYADKAKQRLFQRDWVRRKRSDNGSTANPASIYVEPCESNVSELTLDMIFAAKKQMEDSYNSQSDNPMAVGYVPAK